MITAELQQRTGNVEFWASCGLTDNQHQGHSPGEDVQNGDHGEEDAPSPPLVHSGVPGLTRVEREELTRLRRENRRLEIDEPLKRATVFFARETR